MCVSRLPTYSYIIYMWVLGTKLAHWVHCGSGGVVTMRIVGALTAKQSFQAPSPTFKSKQECR